jgi:hypothetical protein
MASVPYQQNSRPFVNATKAGLAKCVKDDKGSLVTFFCHFVISQIVMWTAKMVPKIVYLIQFQHSAIVQAPHIQVLIAMKQPQPLLLSQQHLLQLGLFQQLK